MEQEDYLTKDEIVDGIWEFILSVLKIGIITIPLVLTVLKWVGVVNISWLLVFSPWLLVVGVVIFFASIPFLFTICLVVIGLASFGLDLIGFLFSSNKQ